MCVVSYLVEKRAVCYGNTQGSKASANHHVIWGVITVAAAAAGHEPGHRHPAEDHSAGGTQKAECSTAIDNPEHRPNERGR